MNFEESLYMNLLIAFCIVLTYQGFISSWQMLFGWMSRENINKNTPPEKLSKPETHFSVIIPCRHEEKVIEQTLKGFFWQKYPSGHIEILIPVASDDTKTLNAIKKVKNDFPDKNIKLIVFDGGPMKKSHFLNVALKEVTGDYVVVFDAEDDVNNMLLSYINTLIQIEGRIVFQTGVSLMNWKSNWFGIHAVMEYYFWFHSRLQWFVDKGIVPLGGVGIFLPKEVITNLKGWDTSSLTEDAKLGIDCALNDIPVRILSQEEYTTREEIPTKLSAFIKQRTRWIQGFIQIVTSGAWLKLPLDKQFYFLSLFTFPLLQIIFYVWFGVSFFNSYRLPLSVVMFSFVPLAILAFQIALQVAGIAEMLYLRRETKYIPLAVLVFLLTYVFYQCLMVVATFRAIGRSLVNNYSWEKTAHVNTHRLGKVGAV